MPYFQIQSHSEVPGGHEFGGDAIQPLVFNMKEAGLSLRSQSEGWDQENQR